MYSSAVERLTADQQVPGSNPGAPSNTVSLILEYIFAITNFGEGKSARGSIGLVVMTSA